VTTPTTLLQFQYLPTGVPDARQQRGARIAGLLVVDRARQPEGEQGRRLTSREVGDHVLHQRLVDQRSLERPPSGRMVDGSKARGASGRRSRWRNRAASGGSWPALP
jgi:hypothetical protein